LHITQQVCLDELKELHHAAQKLLVVELTALLKVILMTLRQDTPDYACFLLVILLICLVFSLVAMTLVAMTVLSLAAEVPLISPVLLVCLVLFLLALT
jgi:hypothetical protein